MANSGASTIDTSMFDDALTKMKAAISVFIIAKSGAKQNYLIGEVKNTF